MLARRRQVDAEPASVGLYERISAVSAASALKALPCGDPSPAGRAGRRTRRRRNRPASCVPRGTCLFSGSRRRAGASRPPGTRGHSPGFPRSPSAPRGSPCGARAPGVWTDRAAGKVSRVPWGSRIRWCITSPGVSRIKAAGAGVGRPAPANPSRVAVSAVRVGRAFYPSSSSFSAPASASGPEETIGSGLVWYFARTAVSISWRTGLFSSRKATTFSRPWPRRVSP
jgi:hypothetical protein